MMLLHGFIKKTQKVLAKEINVAINEDERFRITAGVEKEKTGPLFKIF